MAIKPVVTAAEIQTQTPEELARHTQLQKDAKEKEEARLAAQTPYDPKIHGAGTTPVSAPQSVKELHDLLVKAGLPVVPEPAKTESVAKPTAPPSDSVQ